MPLLPVKRWQPWTKVDGLCCSKVKLTLFLTNVPIWSRLLDAVPRTWDCYLPSAEMTIWWDLMPVYCELYRNWQGHPCILMSSLFPTSLFLSHSLIPSSPPPLFLYWTSKDRRIMLINSTKTSWKTESEDTGVSTRAFVFEKVCVRVCMSNSVWACSATCTSKSGCFFSFLHCFCILQWLCVPPYMDFHSLSIQAGF